jgi:hypothetical protein
MTANTESFRLDDRRSFRHPMAIVTRIRELGGPDVPIVLRDLSAVGFSGDSHARIAAPTVVAVMLPPIGEVRARVCRAKDGLIGGEFLQPLENAALELILEQHPDSLIDAARAV